MNPTAFANPSRSAKRKMNMLSRKLKTGSSLVASRQWSELASSIKCNLRRAHPAEVTARAWDEGEQAPGTQWQDAPGIARRWNALITGDPEQGYIEYVTAKYLTPRQPRRVLSLCCGNGWWERAWAARNAFATVDGYDISPKSIDAARQSAAGLGTHTIFHYQVADLNRVDLGDCVYDLVLVNAGLHHVLNLEHVLAQIAEHLAPGGLLILNEFVGPSRFQWTDRQIEIINGLLAVLPERYRRSLLVPGRAKAEIVRPTVEQMVRADPSEAVRSAEILDLLPRDFEMLECKPWGGAILQLLLYEIAGNFAAARAEDARLLQMLFDVEDYFMQTGEVGSDFVFAVCEPK